MATFIWTGSYGSKKSIEPRVSESQFGDGYSQRVPDGINTMPRSWPMAFMNRSTAEADAIEAFLIARGGAESFDWTDFHGHAGKWICRKWDRDPTNGPYSTITGTFDEVFGE